ncbi:phenylacetate--CoA ligase family protein [Flavisphingomonas formosensis]|uniref:hypothetical protein n=1 Tax=Flavisphingomonas formosensis TaxID=861534 RepID=UPI0012F925C7|nr:hypothetical protein [Sphingomonas formosensis]
MATISADRPEDWIELPQAEIYAIPLADQQRLQREALRGRFAQLVDRIPMLRQLAQEQHIIEITEIADIAPLLVPHSALKSYPMSFLENGRFDRLTQWLDGFTAYDLSGVDARGCDSIDDWLDLLDARTDVRVMHSTGTSGKLSFLPRGIPEMHKMVSGQRRQFDPWPGERPLLGVPIEAAPVIYTQYRHGGMAQHRLLPFLRDALFGGDEDMIIATNPTRFSADVASISGRLRVAESRGEAGMLKIAPRLMERREAFLRDQARSGEHWDAFFDRITGRWTGRTVSIMGHVPALHVLALEAGKRGLSGLFAADSFVAAGGGMKGHDLPESWRATVDHALGGAALVEGYGMTEIVAASRACGSGHYHIPAWHVPFLLDPASGESLPRTGTATGRYGAIDLNASTYWAGFLTGDEVTLHWGDTESCACGRIGPYLDKTIRRYTEKEGGDDKITCAGAPGAHDRALEFIVENTGASA